MCGVNISQNVKKICMVSPHSDPLGKLGEPDIGGQSVYEKELAKALVELGCEVDTYTRHYGEKLLSEEPTKGNRVIRIPCGGNDFIRKEELGEYLPEFADNMLAYVNEHGREYDLIHSHYWDGGAMALLIRDRLSASRQLSSSSSSSLPLTFTSHSLGIMKQLRLPDEEKYNYNIRIQAELDVMKEAELLIVLTDVEKSQLIKHYSIAAAKMRIVPPGIDSEVFYPRGDKGELKKEIGIDADFMVFTTGRLDSRKGFTNLMKCVKNVAQGVEKHGKTVKFLFPAGPKNIGQSARIVKKKLKKIMVNDGVEKYVTFFKHLNLDELARYYSAADIFACPSSYEPFGLVIVEAMACKTPVVATTKGGPIEILTEGVDGFLVDPRDTELMEKRILEILLDDDLRGQMSQNALNTACDGYSWKEVAKKILTVFDEASDIRSTKEAQVQNNRMQDINVDKGCIVNDACT